MLPFQRILFPVDYSRQSETIVPYVKDMAKHYQAALTLLYAYGPSHLLYGEMLASEADWPQRVRSFEVNRLQQFKDAHFPSQHVEIRVSDEDPAAAIRCFVEHQGSDLVMMATRGHGPMRRLLVGSTVAKVLHDISAAVWTYNVPASAHDTLKLPCKSIICALDQTDEAESVLKAASSIAYSYNARLLLLHAVPTPPMALEVDFQEYRKELMDTADFQLREMKAKLGIYAPHVITDRSMFEAIREEAGRVQADLLVVGRGESQGAIARIWSNLYPIIREASCPVMSI
jgi:nucleotide-binding universal stress UspA family protein